MWIFTLCRLFATVDPRLRSVILPSGYLITTQFYFFFFFVGNVWKIIEMVFHLLLFYDNNRTLPPLICLNI